MTALLTRWRALVRAIRAWRACSRARRLLARRDVSRSAAKAYIRTLGAALKADPTHYTVQDCEAWRDLAALEAELSMGDPRRSLYTAAYIAYELANLDSAELILRKHAERFGPDPHVEFFRGRVLLRRGSVVDALEHLTTARSMLPNEKKHHLAVFEALSYLGRRDEACAVLEELPKNVRAQLTEDDMLSISYWSSTS